MILFHVTKQKNLTSILSDGLLIAKSGVGGITLKKIWNPPRIFLTDNPEVPIKQLDYLIYKEDWIILEIDCSTIRIEPHMSSFAKEKEKNNIIPNEFVVYNDISPNFIKKVQIIPKP